MRGTCERVGERDHAESMTMVTVVGSHGQTVRSIASRYVHSTDTLLLVAADAVANATMRLMGENA